jgi:hypothetical protein
MLTFAASEHSHIVRFWWCITESVGFVLIFYHSKKVLNHLVVQSNGTITPPRDSLLFFDLLIADFVQQLIRFNKFYYNGKIHSCSVIRFSVEINRITFRNNEASTNVRTY